MLKLIVPTIVLALIASFAFGKTYRDPAQRRAFMQSHPCPSTGKTKGSCPGWTVDHIKALCVGGADRPSNMQWQTVEASKDKDRREREQCKRTR